MNKRHSRKTFHGPLLLLLIFTAAVAAREEGASGGTFGHARTLHAARGEGGHTLEAPEGGEVSQKGGLGAGSWGGEHVRLEVSEAGAEVEYDCAHGAITRGIVLDRRGRFDVPGTHTEESGGPVRESGRADTYPVRYTGRVRGGRMSLTVRRGDTGKLVGRYELVRGREASLFKCR